VALVLGAVGIALLALPFWEVVQAGGVPFGLIYVMASAIAWAAGTVFIKAVKPEGSPMAITAWQFVIGAVAVTTGMAIFERPHLELDRPIILAAFVYSNVFAQAIAYALWFGLMARVPASTAALGTLLVPIFAVVSSSLWLGERLSALDLAGFALILLGVLLDQGLRRWLGRPASDARATTSRAGNPH
jgi:drug/metabolite transporter (DMT)-like permease